MSFATANRSKKTTPKVAKSKTAAKVVDSQVAKPSAAPKTPTIPLAPADFAGPAAAVQEVVPKTFQTRRDVSDLIIVPVMESPKKPQPVEFCMSVYFDPTGKKFFSQQRGINFHCDSHSFRGMVQKDLKNVRKKLIEKGLIAPETRIQASYRADDTSSDIFLFAIHPKVDSKK